MRYPATVFNSVFASVLFSALARLQDDPRRLGQAFRRTLFFNAIVLLPASTGLIILAPEVIAIILGPNWGGVVLPFQIMTVSMLFRTSHKVGSIVAQATGNVYGVAATQVIYALMIVVGSIIGARWGIAGVAASTAVAVIITFVMLTDIGLRRTTLTWRDVIAAHLPGATAAVLALAAWPVAHLLRRAGAPVLVTVLLSTLAGSVGFMVLFLRGVRRPDSDWAWCWTMLRSMLWRRRRRDAAEPPPAA